MFSGYFGAGPTVTTANRACLMTVQDGIVNKLFDGLEWWEKLGAGKAEISKNLVGEVGTDRFGLLCDAINKGPEDLVNYATLTLKKLYNRDTSDSMAALIRGMQPTLKQQLDACAFQGDCNEETGQGCEAPGPTPPAPPAPAPAATGGAWALLVLPLGLVAWWLWSRR